VETNARAEPLIGLSVYFKGRSAVLADFFVNDILLDQPAVVFPPIHPALITAKLLSIPHGILTQIRTAVFATGDDHRRLLHHRVPLAVGLDRVDRQVQNACDPAITQPSAL